MTLTKDSRAAIQIQIDWRRIKLSRGEDPDGVLRPSAEERAILEQEIADLENKLQTL